MNAFKKNYSSLSIFFALSTLFSLSLSAGQIELTPGLWEHTFKMNSDAMDPKQKEQMEKANKAMQQMKEQMANMPPETRQMMEKMMEKNGTKLTEKGIQNPFMNMQMTGDGAKLKVCVTKEDVARGEMPTQNERCTEHHTQISSNTMKVVFECKSEKGEMESHGETEITFDNAKSYKGKSTLYTSMQGKTQTIHTEQSGQWLSSDCGDIKPYHRKDLNVQ